MYFTTQKSRHYLREGGWENIFQVNGSMRQAGTTHCSNSQQNRFEPKLVGKAEEVYMISRDPSRGHYAVKNIPPQ